MDILLSLLTQFGLPTALLLVLAAYHIRVVRQKDGEIARVNEARIEEAASAAERLLGTASEIILLGTELRTTLEVLGERLRRR